jgi:glycosyltransferase involved in cell wall biosynthesis
MLDHVVVVVDSLNIDGGTAKVALGSAIGLANAGVPVTVFAASGRPGPELLACENLRIVSTEQPDVLKAGNKIAAAVRGIWNRRAYDAMTALLATLDPSRTIVHVHCWTKALSSSVVASAVRAKFPVVQTVHEYFNACPTGCFYLHREREICTLKPLSLRCVLTDCDSRSYAVKLYRVARQWVTHRFGKIPGGIREYFTVSEFSRRVVEPFLPVARRMHAIGNPVEVAREPRVPASRNRAFAFVGRLSAEKGPTLLAEAARIAGVDVVFIGDGPERAAIERANPAATITGWLDPAGVAARVREARCVVVPSMWYETFGLVVLEAAACGIPAIVPTETAPSDLIVPGETGLAFPRADTERLADALRVMSDDATVERMGLAAYTAYWADPPTMAAHVDRLVAAYRDVIGDVATKPVLVAAL